MADKTVSSPAPKNKRGILRKLVWVFCVLVALLVVIYFVATSSAFFTGVILPRVSKSLGADVTVSSASIHPFSSVELRDLKVQSPGQEPLVTAPEVRARYSLMDIIRGKINVSELALVSPVISLVENADGTSNLDALQKSSKESKPKEAAKKESKPGKPAQLDIKKVALSNATVRKIKKYKNGNQDIAELSNVNVSLDDLRNGATGKLALAADVKMDNHPPAPGTNSFLQAKLAGNFSFALTADLKPASVQGETRVEVQKADGAFADVSTLSAILNCDATPTEIKNLALTFQKGGAQLGQIRASGPLDLAKTEGKLTVEILSIDRQVLNLAGAASGIDFGTTKINSTNQIELTKGGSIITAAGKLNAGSVRITRAGQTTPTLDATLAYNVTIDREAKSALLRSLDFISSQNQSSLLRAELASPMNLSWSDTASSSIPDSALNIVLENFNLADWKPFVGEAAPSGKVEMTAKLLSQQGGKSLTFDISSHIANLTAQSGSNKIENADVMLAARGKATDLNQFTLAEYRAELSHSGEKLASISGSGTYDVKGGAADLKVIVEAALAALSRVMPQSSFAATSGSLNLSAQVSQKQNSQTVVGKLTLADFSGQVGGNKFQNFGTVADLDVAKSNSQISIRKAAGTLTESQNAGGSFDVSGNYDTARGTGQFAVKLAGLNQNGLRPFLEAAMADKKLVSVTMSGDLSATLGDGGDKSVKGSIQVANLVVSDPKNPAPAKPLEAKFAVDADVRKQVAEIRQLQVTLTPTARAKNELNFSGRVDMSQTNAIQGALKLAADSLDVTAYYDLFAGDAKTNAVSVEKPSTTPATTSTKPRKEPDAIHLPVRDLSLDVNVGKFYLREIEITSLQTSAKVQGSHIVIKPMQLTLNGAPVTATVDIDLGVAGYKYDVSANLQHVPLAPLVNTFQPDRKGQIGGTLLAVAQIKGAGITDPSIQKNLSGNFDIGTTNLNLAIENLRSPILKKIVNIIVAIPELVKNPTAAVETLAGAFTKSSGGVMDEVTQSPINVIQARGNVGAGKMDLQHALVESPAFQVGATGAIELAEVLNDSRLKIPLTMALRRSIADQVGLAGNTPTNAMYAKLPDFVSIGGTIGKPKEKIDKVAIGFTAIKSILPAVLGDKQLNKLGLGGLLGQKETPAPNAPPANTSPAGNTPQPNVAPKTNPPSLIDDALNNLFSKPKKKKSK